MTRDQVLARLEGGGEIPTIGPIALEVVRLAGDPLADFNSVGSILVRDPSLTVQVLRVANSPYFGLRGEVSDVGRAVGLLGMQEIRNIALTVSVISEFSGRFGGEDFNWTRFWEHSAGCALIAQVFCKLLRLPTGGDEYVAGLLHDVGKILLGHHFPGEFRRVLELAANEGIGMAQAEARVFGTDHTELGGWLCRQWGLPPAVEAALTWHHSVEHAGQHRLLTAVVHLADLFAKAKCIGFGGDFIRVCLTEDTAWQVVAGARPGAGELDVERFTFQLDREVEAARELSRAAGAPGS